MLRKLVIVTNIPSPYRIHLFNTLAKACDQNQVQLKVLFMAATEKGRFWKHNEAEWQFEGKIHRGMHPRLGNATMHLNPTIVTSILQDPPDWLIIGGSWNFPTSLLLYFLRSFFYRNTYVMTWTEANYHKYYIKSRLFETVRKRVLECSDGFIVPGSIALETVQDHWGIREKEFLLLPNVVDEGSYRDKVLAASNTKDRLRKQLGLPLAQTLIVWPARLQERTKGIINFLEATKDSIPSGLTIVIAGEGDDRGLIEEWLRNHAQLDVRLIGHITQDQLIELYANSDLMILPSLQDANPLVVVEALWAGLPILISQQCGNAPEVCVPGRNGWLVDSHDPETMRQALTEIAQTSKEELQAMGNFSLRIAQEHFSTHDACNNLVKELIALKNQPT